MLSARQGRNSWPAALASAQTPGELLSLYKYQQHHGPGLREPAQDTMKASDIDSDISDNLIAMRVRFSHQFP